MNKDKKILIISLVGIFLIASAIVLYLIFKDKKITDAIKIKTEYASLNGTKNSKGNDYPIVNLSNDNPFVYINDSDLLKLLESGSGIVYFGFPSCPWCRTMLPLLEQASVNKYYDKIYYYDVLNIRSKYELNSVGELEKTTQGTTTYYKLLTKLDKFLTDYELTDESGNAHKTGEKRLYAPTVVAIKNGIIKQVHVGTLDSQASGYDKLTDEEKKELTNIYEIMIDKANSNICTEEEC